MGLTAPAESSEDFGRTRAGPRLFLNLVGWVAGAVALASCGGGEPRSGGGVSRPGGERAAFIEWLASSPISPSKAIALVRVDSTVTLGPDTAGIPLDGVPLTRLVPGRGTYLVQTNGDDRTVHRHRPFPLDDYTVLIVESAGQDVVTVYGQSAQVEPEFYPHDLQWVFEVALERDTRHSMRMLALDGIEVEGTHLGTVSIPLGNDTARLEVRSVPDPSTSESDLVIYFRDETNSRGSYPSGRFVTLTPRGDGIYRLDFNEARNPFCAYSTVYPCPVPWAGNKVPAPIEAGERYAGGGYEPQVGSRD